MANYELARIEMVHDKWLPEEYVGMVLVFQNKRIVYDTGNPEVDYSWANSWCEHVFRTRIFQSDELQRFWMQWKSDGCFNF